MSTQDFRTRTIYEAAAHKKSGNTWTVGEDIGYSGVKGYCPNSYFSFPSYATKIHGERINIGAEDAKSTEIIYRDNVTGDKWLVGAVAQNNMSIGDTKDSEESLYGRNRYFNPMFRVLGAVGLGMGLSPNKFGSVDLTGEEILLQTGLPPKYIKSDAELLKEALSGSYDFSLKFGNSEYMDYRFDLQQSNISIIQQPMGTFWSIITSESGDLVPDAKQYMAKNMLIVDIGFRTLDIFPIYGGTLQEQQTFDNLGMCEILKRTVDAIYKKYKIDLSVPIMQQYLEKGLVKKVDRRQNKLTTYPFDDILQKASMEVCMEAISTIKQLYNYLEEINYLVITGGTGAAWYDYFVKEFEGFTDADTPDALKILPGNINIPNIPIFFANAEGYYMYGLNKKRS